MKNHSPSSCQVVGGDGGQMEPVDRLKKLQLVTFGKDTSLKLLADTKIGKVWEPQVCATPQTWLASVDATVENQRQRVPPQPSSTTHGRGK
jgi:hypothetical protein